MGYSQWCVNKVEEEPEVINQHQIYYNLMLIIGKLSETNKSPIHSFTANISLALNKADKNSHSI